MPLRSAGAALFGDPRWFTDPGWNWVRLVARMAPGASVAGAESAATTLYRRSHPDEDPEARVVVAPLMAARGPMASTESAVSRWLFGVTVLVLLIVAANIANMLLARGLRQRREIGVRLALGATRGRLVRESVVEALLMAALGALAALVLAQWGGAAVRAALLPDPAAATSGISGRAAIFAGAASVLAGLVSGILPAIQSTRADVHETLKTSGRGVVPGAGPTRESLAVLQVALSVVLLVGAGLFIRSLLHVMSTDLGIDVDHVLVAMPQFDEGTGTAERERTFAAIAERLRANPAVAHASAVAGSLPFIQSRSGDLYVPGRDSVPTPPQGGPYLSAVEPDYFETLDLAVVEGRGIEASDRNGSEPVVVINRTLARWLWPESSAVGRCIQVISDASPCRTVVGVAEDAHRHRLVEEPAAQVYLPLAQGGLDRETEGVLVRGRRGAQGLSELVRTELLAGGRVRFAGVRSLGQIVAPQSRPWRVGTLLFCAFGLLAVAVATIGIYAVLAFSVAQRLRELGVRAALGADRARLIRLVAGRSLRLVALGVTLGLAAAAAAAGRLGPLLQGVSPHDPLVFGAVALVLACVGLFAAAIPARRATAASPLDAMRAE